MRADHKVGSICGDCRLWVLPWESGVNSTAVGAIVYAASRSNMKKKRQRPVSKSQSEPIVSGFLSYVDEGVSLAGSL